MKKSIFIFSCVLLIMATWFVSCKKKETKPIGEPFSKLEGIQGEWEIKSVIQIDEQTPLKDQLNLDRFYTQNPDSLMSVSFDSKNLTYSVVEGNGKNFFGPGGNWEFDNPNFPSKVILYSNLGDTIESTLGKTIRKIDTQLDLNFSRYCGSIGDQTAVVTYVFQFNRTGN
jgi:hypothetical protein